MRLLSSFSYELEVIDILSTYSMTIQTDTAVLVFWVFEKVKF